MNPLIRYDLLLPLFPYHFSLTTLVDREGEGDRRDFSRSGRYPFIWPGSMRRNKIKLPFGEMAEWLIAPVLKTGIVFKNYRGFESLSLLFRSLNCFVSFVVLARR